MLNEIQNNINHIIINADDFGLNSSVNRAIVDAFDKHFISSTTIMANMPSFEEAVSLAFKNRFESNIGAHLVLTDGSPLNNEISAINFLFSGKLTRKKTLKRELLFLNREKQQLIFKEFTAQIEKIKKAGISITHLDTHHHVHESYKILEILLEIRKIYNISSIRIFNNCIQSSKIHKKAYRAVMNFYLKKNNAHFSDFFGSQTDVISKFKNITDPIKNRKIEIMV
ncbi:MAG: ChbG/HpnK family deacetylase, partial [Ferruginibacter sp.]